VTKTWSFDSELTRNYTRVRQDFISELLDAIRGQVSLESAIDVGCGVGYFSEFLSDRGFQVVAVDGREENAKEGQRRYPGIRFLTRNAEDPALSDIGVFDLVLCVGLLYHLENPLLAIRNLHALTGKILIVESMCTPGTDPALLLLDEGQEDNQGLNRVAFYPTESCLIKMLSRACFPFVYRFRRLPPDRQFGNTLLRKRSRTFLVASKVVLTAANLVPARELSKWLYVGLNPWSTTLSRSRDFFASKIASLRARIVRVLGSSGRATVSEHPKSDPGLK
jgi:SAM-dependent methyltransferase